jgi:hypothetical protein
MANHPNRNKLEFSNSSGDIYRVVPVGTGYGISLWNAHYKAWVGEATQQFSTRKAAIEEAKTRAQKG